MSRLNTQLPSASPSAMSGEFASATALMPVTNSGREVTVANRIRPIHVRLSRAFSAITSPYRDRRTPAIQITATHERN